MDVLGLFGLLRTRAPRSNPCRAVPKRGATEQPGGPEPDPKRQGIHWVTPDHPIEGTYRPLRVHGQEKSSALPDEVVIKRSSWGRNPAWAVTEKFGDATRGTLVLGRLRMLGAKSQFSEVDSAFIVRGHAKRTGFRFDHPDAATSTVDRARFALSRAPDGSRRASFELSLASGEKLTWPYAHTPPPAPIQDWGYAG